MEHFEGRPGTPTHPQSTNELLTGFLNQEGGTNLQWGHQNLSSILG